MSYLDTRELEKERDDLIAERDDGNAHDEARLEALDELAEEVGEDAMRYGETMIPVSEFKEYAMELAEDIGAIDHDASWPTGCIDWDQAAWELSMDYTNVEFAGEDYYVRCG